MHTSRDDHLINILRFIPSNEVSQIYGARLPESMTSPEMKETKAYKTYLGYATGVTPPKKARKFKKPASPKLTIVPASPKEPIKKTKRVKRPAKKSTNAPTTGVVIRDPPMLDRKALNPWQQRTTFYYCTEERGCSSTRSSSAKSLTDLSAEEKGKEKNIPRDTTLVTILTNGHEKTSVDHVMDVAAQLKFVTNIVVESLVYERNKAMVQDGKVVVHVAVEIQLKRLHDSATSRARCTNEIRRVEAVTAAVPPVMTDRCILAVGSNACNDNNRKKAETLAPKPISALTVYPPNTPVKLVPRILPTKSQVKINLYVLTQLFTEFDKTCKTRITPTGITEGERGFEQTKRCYLTEVIPFFKTLKEHFVGVQTALFKEVKEMEEIFDQMNNEVDKNTVDKQCAEIEKKNLLIENENLIVNCLSTQLLYDVEKSRCLDLEADMSKVHDESKLISKLEREYLNLQLKYQHLQESFDNKNSQASQEAPDFNSFFKIKNLEHQIQEKDNVIRNLKVLVANVNDRSCEPYNAKDVTALIEQNDCVRIELEKVKQHYKELYDSIKITRAHTSEKTSTMLNEIESLKAQLRSKEPCFTSDYVKPKVLAPGMYAIDVKPIHHPLKNNRSAHLNYISHLKESVETVREIVEEARVVKPLDNSLNYACQYTKLSQELLEYVIGTCPKSFNERDNKAPSTPVTRKKQVTFSDKPGTSSSNTQKHKVHQRVQQTNIPVIPSTGVNDSTEASGSKPRSNTKKNRILPAKKENKKEVEVRLRTNKSVWTKVNRIDSSISSKRVVSNSNSKSVCKTCNKYVNSASHRMCVVNILNSVNATSTIKTVLNKGKQIWKAKGRLSDNSLYKTKRVWKATGKPKRVQKARQTILQDHLVIQRDTP
ncbi:hypothetical protein Tco_0299061 [Tanacetum coccineum]